MEANHGNLVMVTRASDVEGFPALLNEMLWRGSFSSRPEYSVYARGIGHGMVDYTAIVFIPVRLVTRANHSYEVIANGTSIPMAIQEVAYKAMTLLRLEIPELSADPFYYFPMQGAQAGVNMVPHAERGRPLFERRMSELVRAQDNTISF